MRFTATGGQQVTATEPAEILVWEMHATLRLTGPQRLAKNGWVRASSLRQILT